MVIFVSSFCRRCHWPQFCLWKSLYFFYYQKYACSFSSSKIFSSHTFIPSCFSVHWSYLYRWRHPYSMLPQFLNSKAQIKFLRQFTCMIQQFLMQWTKKAGAWKRCLKKGYAFMSVCYWSPWLKFLFWRTVCFKVSTI